MPYGSYNGPDKPNKGHEGGACNRQRCQAEPALFLNHGTDKWYCADCRHDIQFDTFNLRDWEANYQPRYGYPMFETRAEIDARELPQRIADVAARLRASASESEMGRNLAGTPITCREAAAMLEKLTLGMSTCNKCGEQCPSAPPNYLHKCGRCSGGMMVRNN